MNLFRVSVLTPDGVVYQDTAEYLVAPGVMGEFTIMAGHVPLVAATRAGVLKVVKSSQELFYAIGESLVEVSREQTLVLANHAEPAESHKEALKKVERAAQDADRYSRNS